MFPGLQRVRSVKPGAAAAAFLAGAALLLVRAAAPAATPGEEAPAGFLPTSWHTENGLPDGNVTAIEQTPDGYWWVGTFKGLARFDGVRFTVFDLRRGNSLPEARIAALRVDHQTSVTARQLHSRNSAPPLAPAR